MILVLENEVNPETRYFVPEIRRHLEAAGATVRSYPFAEHGGRPDVLHAADAVVLSGSTAGVYETETYPWMDDLRELVRELVAEKVPTLAVCFGHQLVNDALGGAVEHHGLHAGIDPVRFADDPLFDGVGTRVPLVHSDVVTELGAGMEAIAAADYYPNLASRHRDAPLWTVQYHPEFTEQLFPSIESDFEWPEDPAHRDFDGVTVERTFENFVRLVGAR
ncbi:GMP synthase [Halogeometricum borinquense DSM 11551]|uniref:GMP synthase n=2 Tax=Halogeometricum borinquense TaxID=60847 RepID=E4NTU8_HALBP|nr:type 1 glutamine amidotransferase [Halogeometricum borinquense]ADQ68253.1 GMP synthase family protein [Halogeometricum borinquense DSM 11551]ELY24703.1 GMP synthase [Halogeometricum borinquense DSM 11551]RYJ12852.1 type 1 glutamine amidotransferase [Halogeometricum borinquense]